MKKITVALVLLLAGCTSNSERYSLKNDEVPEKVPSLSHIENARPRYEPYSFVGNNTYEVMGKTYDVLDNPQKFIERGLASWYGQKFHGYKTSNGEIYDMFSMSAAHKTLPLPSYVEVVNTLNNKKIIVRVNDRGPFHEGRVIDLSYAAAAKLDVLKEGTAPVKIRLIKVDKPKDNRVWQERMRHHYFVQLTAISSKEKAMQLAQEYGKQFSLPTNVIQTGNMYRIRLGPFYDNKKTRHAQQIAKEYQLTEAFIVVEAKDTEPSAQ